MGILTKILIVVVFLVSLYIFHIFLYLPVFCYPKIDVMDENCSIVSCRGYHCNSKDKTLATVMQHYNTKKDYGKGSREKSKIVVMRKYNNWVKRITFEDVTQKFQKMNRPAYSLIGLDLCCGKGGDLSKWEKSEMMKHVVFVDISEESLRVKLANPQMMFDLVSCQFALHYSFESCSQVHQMLMNVTANLVSGGYFIGTLPNADRIVNRCRLSGTPEIGNEIYKIKFHCDEPYDIFGTKYSFDLCESISCPEFLVHFPTLVSLAENFGLSLRYRYDFDEICYQNFAKGDIFKQLKDMGALETYPPENGKQMNFAYKYYHHAQMLIDLMQQKQPHYDWTKITLGTISYVEWEAIQLYLVYCFRKL